MEGMYVSLIHIDWKWDVVMYEIHFCGGELYLSRGGVTDILTDIENMKN